MGLSQSMFEKYESFTLNEAIAAMDDIGWCPRNGCNAVATIEKEKGFGQCSHCEFMFCLQCKDRYHPYKRCLIHRLDLNELIS